MKKKIEYTIYSYLHNDINKSVIYHTRICDEYWIGVSNRLIKDKKYEK